MPMMAFASTIASSTGLGQLRKRLRRSSCSFALTSSLTPTIHTRLEVEDIVLEDPGTASWSVAEWHGKMLVDATGEKIGRLQDVYVDVETDVPQFGTVKEGLIGRHLTFVPLAGVLVGTDSLQVTVAREKVRSAPDLQLHGEEMSQDDESALYHHFEQNYVPSSMPSGRRLARR
jgi:hypothetical protein